MGTFTRITLGIFVSICLWASLNVPQAKVLWNHITPNVVRHYAGPTPKTDTTVAVKTQSAIAANQECVRQGS